MNERLEARVRDVRKRWLLRSWEYRRRAGSGGVWLRLARALAGARELYVIDAADAARLEQEGARLLEVGLELHPQKRLFLIDEDGLATLDSARSVDVRLSAEVLSAPHLALVPFDSDFQMRIACEL